MQVIFEFTQEFAGATMDQEISGQVGAVVVFWLSNVELDAHQAQHLVNDVCLAVGVAELLLEPGQALPQIAVPFYRREKNWQAEDF